MVLEKSVGAAIGRKLDQRVAGNYGANCRLKPRLWRLFGSWFDQFPVMAAEHSDYRGHD